MAQKIDWNGHPRIPGLTRNQRRLRTIIKFVQRRHSRAYITSTHDGGHAYRSLHGQWSRLVPNWRAVDFGGPTTAVKERVQRDIYANFPHDWITELFGPANFPWISNGHPYTATEGSAIETQHDTHVHLGI